MTLADSGFDRVAALYDPLARLVFGAALEQAQHRALAGLPPGQPTVLIIGGGSGAVLLEVLRQRPRARILFLEAAPLMLIKARQTLARHAPDHAGQVEFRLGTEALLRPGESFDAIVTFFFLDLFAPDRLRAVVGRLAAARRPGAPWLLADFRPTRRLWHRALRAAMYAFFRLTTGISARRLPDLPGALAAHGLVPREQTLFYGDLVEATVYGERPGTNAAS